jgi:hypothetical protein
VICSYVLECNYCGIEYGTYYEGETLRHTHSVTTAAPATVTIRMTK